MGVFYCGPDILEQNIAGTQDAKLLYKVVQRWDTMRHTQERKQYD